MSKLNNAAPKAIIQIFGELSLALSLVQSRAHFRKGDNQEMITPKNAKKYIGAGEVQQRLVRSQMQKKKKLSKEGPTCRKVLHCFSTHRNVLKTRMKNELDAAIDTNPTPTPPAPAAEYNAGIFSSSLEFLLRRVFPQNHGIAAASADTANLPRLIGNKE